MVKKMIRLAAKRRDQIQVISSKKKKANPPTTGWKTKVP